MYITYNSCIVWHESYKYLHSYHFIYLNLILLIYHNLLIYPSYLSIQPLAIFLSIGYPGKKIMYLSRGEVFDHILHPGVWACRRQLEPHSSHDGAEVRVRSLRRRRVPVRLRRVGGRGYRREHRDVWPWTQWVAHAGQNAGTKKGSS